MAVESNVEVAIILMASLPLAYLRTFNGRISTSICCKLFFNHFWIFKVTQVCGKGTCLIIMYTRCKMSACFIQSEQS